MAGIPKIVPYPMPTAPELPENIAPWTVDPARAVLLVHDMQRFFVRALGADGVLRAQLCRHVAALREAADRAGVPVAYTVQPGSMTEAERGLLVDFWGPGMNAEPGDRAVTSPLEPRGDDRVYTKWRYSAFFASELLADLRAAGRDQLVLCGVYAHVGVQTTAIESFSHDIETFVVADAVADFTAELHRGALEYMASRCAVVSTTDRVVERFEAHPVEHADDRHAMTVA